MGRGFFTCYGSSHTSKVTEEQLLGRYYRCILEDHQGLVGDNDTLPIAALKPQASSIPLFPPQVH